MRPLDHVLTDLDNAVAKAKGLIHGGSSRARNRQNWMAPNGRRNPTGGFLTSVPHAGENYYATGKVGRHIKTGKRVAEYGHKAKGLDSRVWADVRGRTYGD